MSNKELSPTMQACVEYMREHGNKIQRYPGGFWAHENWNRGLGGSFGTTTVEALVKRGVAEYSNWKARRRDSNSVFPIEATLTGQQV